MSLQQIKTTLEQFLYAQVTTIPIKAYNTNIYTLNGSPTDPTNINSFIEARTIPITQDRELISSAEPYNTRAFFQVLIYQRLNSGTGNSLTIEQTLNALFREKDIVNVRCEQTSVLSPFEDGEWNVTAWRVETHLWN